jgi:hypothetical protein
MYYTQTFVFTFVVTNLYILYHQIRIKKFMKCQQMIDDKRMAKNTTLDKKDVKILERTIVKLFLSHLSLSLPLSLSLSCSPS